MQLTKQKKYKPIRRKPVHTINNVNTYVKYIFLLPLLCSYTKPGNGPFELKNCGSLLTVHCYIVKIVEFECGFSLFG